MELAANDTSLPNSDASATDSAAGPNPSAPEAADTHAPAKTNGDSQSDEARMLHLFAGLDRLHGTYNPAKATTSDNGKKETHDADTRTVKTPPTLDLWRRHLAGQYPLGISPAQADGNSTWGAIEIDEYDNFTHSDLARTIAKLGLPLTVCKSKSGGVHLFLFLSSPMPTPQLRKQLASMIPLIELPVDKVFPTDDGPTGSGWIYMPYMKADGGNEYAFDKSGNGLTLYRFLREAEEAKVAPADLAGLIAKAKKSLEAGEEADSTDEEDIGHTVAAFERWLAGALTRLENAPIGKADNGVYGFAKDIGRFLAELDFDIEPVIAKAQEAWKRRKGDLDRFDEQWGNGIRDGKEAGNPPWPRSLTGASLDRDFYAYMPMHQYFYIRDNKLWPAASIDGKFGMKGKVKASKWLDRNRSVLQAIWAPGKPKIIVGEQFDGEGWEPVEGAMVYNYYNAPRVRNGDPNDVAPWLDLIRRIFPAEADHLVKWFAHRVQRPGEKLNHALLLGGSQGIGKDTMLEPVIRAVGGWNVRTIRPTVVFGGFNEYVKCVILRINEVHDLGEHNRYSFYDKAKELSAAPPTMYECDAKYEKPYPVANVCGLVMTTNHKTDGLYIPENDRRIYVAWSDAEKEQFDKQYWEALWAWYKTGGTDNVAAYLRDLDISDFDPEEPPKTAAWHAIVYANRAPESADLQDALEALGNPDALTVDQIKAKGSDEYRDWLSQPRHRRQIPHRLGEAGYERVVNKGAKTGEWKIGLRYHAVYVKKALSERDKLAAASDLCARLAKEATARPAYLYQTP